MSNSKDSRLRQTLQKILDYAEIKIDGDNPRDIKIHDDRFYSRVWTHASLGLGESYMDGWWDCDKLDEFYYRILKAGGTVVPTNPIYKGRELQHILNDSGAAALITNKDSYLVIKEIEDEIKLETIILTDLKGSEGTVSLPEILTKCSPAPHELDIKPKEDVAAIQYTGGTTGFPKGAMLTHYNLVANAIQNAAWFGWNKDDVVMGLLPFSHSWGACTCVNSPIYCGARVLTLSRFDPQELLKTIEKERVTILYGAASMFTMLVSDSLLTKYELSSLKYVKAGAMPIPPAIKNQW